MADLVRQRQDLIVLRSFSKLYGMAGLRLGAALAPPGLQTKLASLGSNPLSVPAMAAGIASLRDPQLLQTRRAENARVRDDTVAWLKTKGYTCLPTQANCFLARRQARRQRVRRFDAETGRHRRPQLADLAQARAHKRRHRGRDAAFSRGVCQGEALSTKH